VWEILGTNSTINYRVLTTVEALEEITALEIEIWGMAARDVVPSNIMHAITHNGGLALGAYEGGTMVGMALGFPAQRDGKRFFWSHMAGVLPTYQGGGIGFALKQQQRVWALEQGYDEIRWTFDPIQRGNAHFNLHLLGCTANTYYEDFYGQSLNDALNVSAPTDRLEAVWKLRKKSPRPRKTSPPCPLSVYREGESAAGLILWRGGDDTPQLRLDAEAELPQVVYAEMPPSGAWLRALPAAGMLAWRLALREALQTAFGRGYWAVDVAEQDERAYYVLERQPSYALYVVECSDGTLYTGIARDVDRRVAQHNAGKGAAYTAARRPVRLLAAWQYADKSAALRAELAFKAQARGEKLRLIENGAVYREGSRITFEG
jgi:predicted GNAT superfamily acetyltransferase